MNNLYQELVAGKLETLPNGVQSTRAPTSLELRAAKVIQTLVGVNENNNNLIQQMQFRESTHIDDITKYRKDIEELTQQNELLTKDKNECVLDGERKASKMDSRQLNLFGSLGDGESLH